jgi:hypothetical protein
MSYLGVSPSNGVRRVHTYTATASQTSFSGSNNAEGVTLSYKDSNFVDVYQNGVKLASADYTATSGTAIVLGTGATVNDMVVIVVFDVFSAADTVSKADGGTFDGNVTMAGTLAVTGTTALTGNTTASGTLGVTGAITGGSLVVDDITIDGSTISDGGDLTVDSGGTIILDGDTAGDNIHLKDGGTHYGSIVRNNSDLEIKVIPQDEDILFKGNDGGSAITALTLDMSAAGQANFNSNIFTGNTAEFVDGTGTSDKGIQLNPIGLTVSTRNGGISGIFGRQASNGPIVQFRKDGVSLGEIGVNSADLSIYNTISGHTGLRFGNGNIMPTDNSGGISDNTADLGESSYRFKNFYVGSNIYLGGTGSANAFSDYEEGTWTPTLVSTSATFQYSVQSGFYTKVGRVVNFTCVIQLDGGGNSFTNNSVALNGWPFQSTANAHSRFFIYGRYLNLDLGNGYTYAYAHLNGNSSSATLHESGDNVPTATIVSNDLSSSSGQLYLNGQYITDS